METILEQRSDERLAERMTDPKKLLKQSIQEILQKVYLCSCLPRQACRSDPRHTGNEDDFLRYRSLNL